MISEIHDQMFSDIYTGVQGDRTNVEPSVCKTSDLTHRLFEQRGDVSYVLVKPMMGKISAEIEGGYSEEKGGHIEGKVRWEFERGKEVKESKDRPEQSKPKQAD